jgi:hypothetical protein
VEREKRTNCVENYSDRRGSIERRRRCLRPNGLGSRKQLMGNWCNNGPEMLDPLT